MLQAAFHTDGEMVARLLDWKADLKIQDQGQRTALHWATDNPTTDALQVLLKAGARGPDFLVFLNQAASDGMTPVMHAKKKEVNFKAGG